MGVFVIIGGISLLVMCSQARSQELTKVPVVDIAVPLNVRAQPKSKPPPGIYHCVRLSVVLCLFNILSLSPIPSTSLLLICDVEK